MRVVECFVIFAVPHWAPGGADLKYPGKKSCVTSVHTCPKVNQVFLIDTHAFLI